MSRETVIAIVWGDTREAANLMTLRELLPEKKPFKNVHVAVVGDVVLDCFTYGTTSRLSPEAPVPVVHVKERDFSLGGAGNAANNLKALGAIPYLIGRVGDDDSADSLRDLCLSTEINSDYLITSTQPTITKNRIVAQGQQIVRIDDEKVEISNKKTRSAIISALKRVRKKAEIVLVSDYAKGVIDQEVFDAIKEIWAEGTIIVDPKPRGSVNYSGASFVTPNTQEVTELLSASEPITSDEVAAKAIKALKKKLKANGILLTRAGDGMTLLDGSKVSHFAASNRKEVRDVSGAGDTVVATFAACLARGLVAADATELANIAAGLAVSKSGTATVTWAEIIEEMKDSDLYPTHAFRSYTPSGNRKVR